VQALFGGKKEGVRAVSLPAPAALCAGDCHASSYAPAPPTRLAVTPCTMTCDVLRVVGLHEAY